MDQPFDIAIAGAGMTGSLMAVALHHCGSSCVLVDPAPARAPLDDGRTTALAYASVRLFKRVGLWDAIAPKAGPITDILVSNGEPKDRFRQGSMTGGRLHFPVGLLGEKRPDDAEEALGYIVENRVIMEALRDCIAASGIEVMHERGVTGWQTSANLGHGTLRLSDGSALQAGMLVACDGRASPLRSLMKLQTVTRDYRQTAIVFNVAHEKPHGGVAHEVFYPGGPFAILPMQGNQCSIVWTEDTASAAAFLAMDDEAFLEAARSRIGDHLGKLTLASPRQSFPLSLLYAPKLTAERFALAGDAAHGIHPIAGQGFNLGVKDVAALCQTVTEARDVGLDVGHGSVLDNYDRWRRFDAATMSFGTDVLNRLFSNDFAPLKHARGLGLALVQKSDPLRRFFIRASGADLGELPDLMRPL